MGSHTELLEMQQPVQQQQSGSSVGGKLSDEDMFTVAMLMKNNKMDRQQAIQAVMKQKNTHL
jgi:hypothetical protein